MIHAGILYTHQHALKIRAAGIVEQRYSLSVDYLTARKWQCIYLAETSANERQEIQQLALLPCKRCGGDDKFHTGHSQ